MSEVTEASIADFSIRNATAADVGLDGAEVDGRGARVVGAKLFGTER